jgi:aspartate/methionine/tyrosine aminotransferase
LRKLGFEVETPQAAFYIWFRAPAGYSSLQLHTKLLEKAHVSATPGHIYGANGEGWLRLSLVANTERLQEALGRVERVMGG